MPDAAVAGQLAGIAALSAATAALSCAAVVGSLSWAATASALVLSWSTAVRAAVMSPDWRLVRIPDVSVVIELASADVIFPDVWLAATTLSIWSRAANAAPDAALAAAETSTLGKATEPPGTVEALGEQAAIAIATATPATAATRDRWLTGRPSSRIPLRSVVAFRGATSCVFIARR